MRRKLVAGNWKMHGSRADNGPLIEAILAAPNLESVDCVVCPPFVYLAELALDTAEQVLKPGGAALIKLFQGSGFTELLTAARRRFSKS